MMDSEVIARACAELQQFAGFLRAANVQLDKAEAHITYWVADSPIKPYLNRIQELLLRFITTVDDEVEKLTKELH
jgi:hypothetical protein